MIGTVILVYITGIGFKFNLNEENQPTDSLGANNYVNGKNTIRIRSEGVHINVSFDNDKNSGPKTMLSNNNSWTNINNFLFYVDSTSNKIKNKRDISTKIKIDVCYTFEISNGLLYKQKGVTLTLLDLVL